MRTSLNNIREIERYVEGTMDPDEIILFEEKIRRDPLLKLNVGLHEKVLAFVRMYHRKKLKKELEDVHERLFNDTANITFRQRLMRIFGDF